jgi:hypothetical protein
MFRSLLSPLRSRFDLSPRTPTTAVSGASATSDADTATPEDFARDVLVELMRNSVEDLKAANGTKAKSEVCIIHVGTKTLISF